MTFDLRPFVTDDPNDGQIYTSEGITPDMYENCTMACLRASAHDYGYGKPFDSEQLRQFGAPGTHGGLGWGASITAARRAFPSLASDMAQEQPGDVAVALRNYGGAGFMVHVAFWCDSQAWVPAKGRVVASHAVRLLAANDGGLVFQNPWPHPDFYLTDSQVRGLWDEDGILVFKRPLTEGAMTEEQRKEIAEAFTRLIYAALGDRGLAQSELDMWVNNFLSLGFGRAMQAAIEAPEFSGDMAKEHAEHTSPASPSVDVTALAKQVAAQLQVTPK